MKTRLEKIIFARCEAWVIYLLIVLFICFTLLWTLVLSYSAEYHKNRNTKVRNFIKSAAMWARDIQYVANDQINPQVTRFSEFRDLKVHSEKKTNGYILYSSHSAETGGTEPAVYLYDLQKREIIKTWNVPFDQIDAKSVTASKVENLKIKNPFLHDDGSVTFNHRAKGSLISVDACSKLKYINNEHNFHHSINQLADGSLVMPSRPSSDKKGTGIWKDILQEEMTIVDEKGEVTFSINLTELLLKDYYALIVSPKKYGDLLHTNDIEQIKTTDNYFSAGDLMFSFRNINSIMVTDKDLNIKFLKTGPWTYQHDIDYHGNGVFTLFGNDSVSADEISTIYQYDFKNDTATSLLSSKDIFTNTQGLHRLLEDGSLFIEVTDKSIIKFYDSDKQLVWEYVHNVADDKIAAIHWSRYFTADEMSEQLLSNIQCPSQND